ncbi:hypothetical protein LCGC14_0725440 [marine sediment metagenome]|uniref:Uncharacterized protein n=1 Tax=marine sediment metagenome TaxID=412755 RepID=A0A0F9QB58_9ZZZZ|nr:MAG: hypothetical protein Lokiarch_43870 [Candidatus Lokiarchaeum sp. GC14_75]
MTEIEIKELLHENEQFFQLDFLFEIYSLREVRKKIGSKLNSIQRKLKSSSSPSINYSLEALKVIVTENNSRFKDLKAKINSKTDLFELIKNLEKNQIYLKNIEKDKKLLRTESETYELTRGYYLQRIIDIIDDLKQLKKSALSYYQELKNSIVGLEDQRIGINTDKMRKIITKEEFKVKHQKIEKDKQEIEEKMAFLHVKIIDCEFYKNT